MQEYEKNEMLHKNPEIISCLLAIAKQKKIQYYI